jgi:glyceraldehyde 3-phosphate dehydrogenase
MENIMSKIGINGFGRIGRLVLRRLLETSSSNEVVAINDLTSPKVLAYLLKYDSNYGPFPWSVDFSDNALIVDGKTIKVFAEKEAKNIPWKSEGAEIVVECTGFYTSAEKSQAHIDAGAKKVLISAPAGDIKTLVFNVNDDTLNASDTIISVASCTTNCLAPMAKALNDAFEIKVGTMTTIHAYTGTQALVDGPRGKDLRASRAAAENIIPHTTGAAKAIGLVIPALVGKLKGHAQRVPTKTGSVTELVSILGKKVTVDEVNAALKKATENNESFGYTNDDIVSTDIIGTHFGSVFDATQTEVTEAGDLQLVKTVAWYDNEYGFVTQLIRVLEKYAKL